MSSEREELDFGNDPRADAYDVVVIGGGIGGLSSAAFLAHAGKSVLLVEQHDGIGGFARAFRRGPYTFDPAVHVYPDAEPDGLPMSLYRFLGVDHMLDFRQTDPYYRAVFPSTSIVAPVGLEAYIEEHQRLFPAESEGIEKYFRLCVQVHREAHAQPPALGLGKLDEASRQFPVLFKYSRATVAQAVEEHLVDPRLRAVASAMWPYIGTPPSKASLITLATHISVLVEGSYYPAGSAQTTADALGTAISRNGGEIVVERSVEGIDLEHGRVAGVVLDGGSRITAPVVVSAIAAPQTFEQLIGLDHLPSGFVKRYKRMKPGHSAVLVYAATSLDLQAMGAAHENFLSLHDDHEESWRDVQEGKPAGCGPRCPPSPTLRSHPRASTRSRSPPALATTLPRAGARTSRASRIASSTPSRTRCSLGCATRSRSWRRPPRERSSASPATPTARRTAGTTRRRRQGGAVRGYPRGGAVPRRTLDHAGEWDDPLPRVGIPHRPGGARLHRRGPDPLRAPHDAPGVLRAAGRRRDLDALCDGVHEDVLEPLGRLPRLGKRHPRVAEEPGPVPAFRRELRRAGPPRPAACSRRRARRRGPRSGSARPR